MPTYKTRAKRPQKKKPVGRGTKKGMPQDSRKLLRWAGRGSVKDYTRLAEAAKKLRHTLPAFIDGEAFEKLLRVDRLLMIEEIQAAEQHDLSAGAFLDAVSWVLDKVPWGNWLWPVSAAQSAIKAQKGDALNEVDEQYARLVGATYGPTDNRPYVIDHWRRQTQFDSGYISVWDNPDGHRVICIRGTEGGVDIAQDALIALIGTSTDAVGREILSILAATPESVVVDLAAHSLGTSLALASYGGQQSTFDRIHETYMYNPAYSPLVRGTSDAYEGDSSVRYFINLNDLVSMGSLGHDAPSNVVFRSEGSPLSAHKLAQWQGSGVHTPQYHAPPEGRVHAHKAVFGERQAPDNFTDLLKENYVGEPASAAGLEPSGAAPALDAVQVDFGADFEYIDADG